MSLQSVCRWFLEIALCGLVFSTPTSAEEKLPPPFPHETEQQVSRDTEPGDDLSVVLFERSEKPSGMWKFCTGFLVERQGKLSLITARHMAREFSARLRLGIPGPRPIWLDVSSIVEEGESWSHHLDADVSVLHLKDRLGNHEKALRGISLPFDALAFEPPPLRSEVEILGYPTMLGTWENGEVAQFIIPAKVVSRMVTPPAEWKLTRSFLVTGGAAEGMSGGPVLVGRTPGAKVQCVGTYYGVLADRSGAKLSIIVPAQHIRELLVQGKSDDTEAAETEPQKKD